MAIATNKSEEEVVGGINLYYGIAPNGSKFMWVNNRGQITWSDEAPSSKYDWFKAEGERKAYSGEDVLLNFIKAWGNVSSNGDCYLETIDKIVKGDVTELKKLVEALQDNRVRILLGVKDGKYQQTYTKHFGRLKPQRNDMFTKELNSDYGGFNSAYPEDLRLAPYTEKLVAPSEEQPARSPFLYSHKYKIYCYGSRL